jgi:hypothetical protein
MTRFILLNGRATDEVSKATCGSHILGLSQGINLGDVARMVDQRHVEGEKTIFARRSNSGATGL